MSEVVWESEFEWIDQTAIMDEQAKSLSIPEALAREETLAVLLGAYVGRYVAVRNSSVVASAQTLKSLLDRKPEGSIFFVE